MPEHSKCPKCKSENIEDQKLSVALNTKNSPRPIFKCKDCGEVFSLDQELKKKS